MRFLRVSFGILSLGIEYLLMGRVESPNNHQTDKEIVSKKYSVKDHKPTFWGPRTIPPQTGIDITLFFWPVKLSKSKLLQKGRFVPNLEEIGESQRPRYRYENSQIVFWGPGSWIGTRFNVPSMNLTMLVIRKAQFPYGTLLTSTLYPTAHVNYYGRTKLV